MSKFLRGRNHKLTGIIGFLLMFSLIGVRGRGQILWSTSTTGGAWLSTGNWTGGVVPGTTGYAQFQINPTSTGQVGINLNGTTNNGTNNQAVGAIEVTGSRTVPLIIGNSSTTSNGTFTLNGITINGISNVIFRNSTGQTLTIQDNTAGGSKTMTLALGNTTANVVNVDGAGNIVISSLITGSGKNITFNSASGGDLRLSSTTQNTFTGGFTANGSTGATGKFRFDATTAFPTSGNIAITNYGRLSFNVAGTYGVSGQTMTFTPTQIANGSLENNTSNIATIFPGSVVLSADTRIEPAGATGSITLSGNATGSGNVIKQAAGNLILSGTGNTLTGGTQIGNGTLTVNNGSSMGSGNLTFAQTSTNNTSIVLNNVSQTVGNLSSTFTATSGTQTQTLTLNGTALTINQTSNTSFGAGAVPTLTSTITGTGSVIKAGAGTLTLTNSNTYSGYTNITGGTIQLGITNGLPVTTALTVTNSAGAIFDLNNKTQTIGSLSGGGTSGGNITLGSGNLIIGDATNTSYGGIINGTGTVIKQGSGTLTISGINTYSGGTNINGGTLQLAAVNTLPAGGSFINFNGGTLQTGFSTGYSQTGLGFLTLSDNSIIALGTGIHTLNFAASNGAAWTSSKTLTITGWAGTAGSSGTSGKIFVGTDATGLTTAQLAQITFSGYSAGAQILSTGEVVPLCTPPTISSQPSATAQMTCQNGTAFTALSVTATGSGTLTYQWYSNTTQSNTGGTSLNSGATSSSYIPDNTTAGTLYYYVVVTNSGCFTTSNVSGAFNVSVLPTITTQPSTTDQNICQGSIATALTVTTSGGTPGYQWYSNTAASNSGGTMISGATSSSYTPSTATAGTLYYYVVITNGSCTVTSNISGAVNVSASTIITTQPSTATQNVCQGNAATILSITTSGGTPGYQWYSNTTASNTGGTLISGATTTSYTPSTSVAGTLYYYVVVTNGTCTATSNVSGAINVSALPVITTQPSTATQNICQGNTATALSVTTSGGIPNFQWYSNATASNIGGTAISGATSATYTPSTATAGTLYYYVIVTNGTCTLTSNVSGAINVSALPTITAQPSTAIQNICQGGVATALSVTTSGGTPNYQWYSNTSASNSGGTLVSGATLSSYTPSTATAGTLYYYVVITNGTCTVISNVSGAINVSALPTITAQPSTATQNLCQGSTATALTVTTSGGTPTYQWYSNTTASNIGGTAVSGAISSSYTPSTITAGTLYYYVVVINGSCTVTSNVSGAITVNANVTPSVSITASPSGAICPGTSVTFTATPINGGSSPMYQWQLNGSDISGANGSTYTSSTLNDGDKIDVVLTSNATCAMPSNATSNIITMSVTTAVTPSIMITASANPACAGSSVTFTLTTSGGGSSPAYQWQINGTIAPGASTGSTYTTSSLNNGDMVTCLLTSSAVCASPTMATSNIISITVYTPTTITLTSGAGTDNQTVAQGSLINNITYAIGGNNPATSASVTGLPTGVSGSYSAGVFTISGSPTALGTFNYTVNTSGGCGSPTASGTITVVCAIPTQDTGIAFPTFAANSMTISWTVGNGSGRVVIMNTINSFTNPVNSATLPTANTVYSGAGQQVIYTGAGNSVSVTGLIPSTTYWYRVYEYNLCLGTYVYDTGAVTASHNPNNKSTTGAPLVKSNFISVLTPQYIVDKSGTRLPLMFRATVTGLTPSTNYRYYTSGTVSSDFGSNSGSTGAGNPLFVNNISGTVYKYSTSASVSTAGGYDSLTTDASGNYTGWFGILNTTNTRFTAGNKIYPAITLANGSGTILYRLALNDSITALSFATTAVSTSGSFWQSKTSATAKNLVAVFDNTVAGGRPLFIAPVEYINNTGSALASRPTGYDSSAGAWNAILPNVNANGIRAIEQLSVTTGSLIGCIATSSTGIWPTGPVNTVNPTNGATVKVISGKDDPLTTCAVYPAISVLQGTTTYANPSTYTYSNTVVGTNNDVTFTIKNLGADTLKISGITLSGSTVYSIQGTVPTIILAGSSATFIIRFSPTSAITFAGSVTIANNDPNNPSYVINLSGTGYTRPVINVQQGSTNYPNSSTYTYNNTVVANNNDVTFTIQDTGNAVLNISSIVIGGAAYSLQGTAPASVPVGGSATFVVRFTPPSAGPFTGSITINSNDPNQGTYVVYLNGTGTSATITTGIVPGSPFCVGSMAVPVSVSFTYTPTATFTGSTFTAQLSDASGSFASPVTLGTISSDGSGSQNISGNIPGGTVAGAGYRIRVVSDVPIVTGSNNGVNLTITTPVTPTVTISQSPTGNICSGTSITFTAAPINGGTTPTYQWQVNGSNVPGETNSTFNTTTLANNNTVDVVMTSSISCVTIATVTSNLLTETITAPSTITLTSAPGTDTQTVAQSGTITTIKYAIGGGGTGATVTGLPTGVTGSYGGGVFTISGSPSVTGIFKYIVTAIGGCNNNPMDTGIITVNAQSIIIANNPPQVGIGNILVGSTKNLLSTFEVTNNLAGTTTFSKLTTPLTSNYKAADIAGFKLYTNTVDTFSTATQLGTTQNSISTGTGETLTFNFTQTIPTVTTYYYWLTTDITVGAQTGDSITASALTPSNFTFTGSPVTGSILKAGAQIIIASAVTPGALTVLRVGNGLTAPGASSLPVNIYQYNTTFTAQSGALLTTLPFVPTTTPGANRALVQSATATSEGALNLSANARLITFVGYNDNVGDPNVAKTPNVDAVIGKMDAFVNASTTTSYNRKMAYDSNNFRSAVTVDGSGYWTAGTQGSNSPANLAIGGIRYITDGTYSGVGNLLSSLNTRVINIYNGQLYVSSASGSNIGVNTVGSGLPTSSGQTVTLLNSVPTASAYSYLFLNTDPSSSNPNLLYVAGTGSSTQNGIFKYYYNGTSWSLVGSAISGTSVFGITGTIDTTGKVILFATTNTTGNSKPNTLMKYIDNSAPSAAMSLTATNLASSGSFYTFGGVSFTPLANGDTTVTGSGVTLSGVWRNITVASGGSATLTGNVQVLGSIFVKSGGTLNCGTYTISSYSPDFRSYFNVANGATLITANVNGISTTGGIGSVQTSVFDNTSTTGINCNRYFDPGANYIYNGVIAQQTGNGLPRTLTGNLTINDTAGVTLSSAGQVINGNLTLTNGALILPASSNDTLGGIVTHTSGSITGNVTSSLVFNGSGSKALYFTPGNYYMKNITVNSGATNVGLDDSLYVTAGTAANTFGTVTANGTFTTNGFLTLKSNQYGDAQVGISSGSISGNAIVERYIPQKRAWRFLAVPTNGSAATQTIKALWQEGAQNPTITSHNNPLPGYGTEITYDNINAHGYDQNTTYNTSIKVWDPFTNDWSTTIPYTTGYISNYPAYCLFVRGSRAIDLSIPLAGGGTDNTTLRTMGTLNQGNISKTYTTVSGNGVLVANPYASPISILTVLSANSTYFQNQFAIWDPKYAGNYGVGGYRYYASGWQAPGQGSYAGGTTAQSGQAFMLTAINTGTANVGFNESSKIPTGEAVVNTIKPDHPAIYANLLTQSGDSLFFVDGVTEGFGNGFSTKVDGSDMQKFANDDENMVLIRDGAYLAIELRPVPALTDTFFYRLYLKQQPYALQIFGKELDNITGKAWLVDKYLNIKTSVNLDDTTLYRFTPNSDTNSYRNRFMLVFKRIYKATPVVTKPLSGINTTSYLGGAEATALQGTVRIYPNPVITGGKVLLSFNNMKAGKYEITLSSIEGKTLAKKAIEHKGGDDNYDLQLDARWATGSYLLTVAGESGYKANIKLIIGK